MADKCLITKEWLLKTIAELEEERDSVPGVVNEDAAMSLAAMKIALASIEADSKLSDFVASQESLGVDFERALAENMEELYVPSKSTPPAPVSLPDESAVELLATDLMKRIDKITGERHSVATLSSLRVSVVEACRAVMLQSFGNSEQLEPVTTAYKLPEETGSSLQLRNLIRQRHAEWSQATFGDVGPVGPLKHLSKEALEAAAEPDDLSEWADMQFLLWDAQRRAGISDGEITAAMEEKLKVNMARQWPEPKDGEPRLHIKAAPQQEVK